MELPFKRDALRAESPAYAHALAALAEVCDLSRHLNVLSELRGSAAQGHSLRRGFEIRLRGGRTACHLMTVAGRGSR